MSLKPTKIAYGEQSYKEILCFAVEVRQDVNEAINEQLKIQIIDADVDIGNVGVLRLKNKCVTGNRTEHE